MGKGCWEGGGLGIGESDGSTWADSHESLNRCFTMAFCFTCFIEQRADIHVNLALLQSARSCGEYSALSFVFSFILSFFSLSLFSSSYVIFFFISHFFPIFICPHWFHTSRLNLLHLIIFHWTFSIIQEYTKCTHDKDRRFL